MLRLAAARTRGLDAEPPPFVLYHPFGDFAVNYEINACTRDAGRVNEIQADLHRNILDLFNEYGVQIMTPAYEGDPDQAKVVEKERWYTQPAPRDVDLSTPMDASGPRPCS
jgi:small-conductance mechanosensitive channel